MGEADSQLETLVRERVRAELGGMFDELKRFVDRRLAELSTEIHATVQLVGFSEASLSEQLSRIHDQIGSVVALPADAARNSGVELEAVVQATETAANRILEAAEAISRCITGGTHDPGMDAAISEKVNAIFEACTFQDLTGQRIHRAITHLQRVEIMLDEIMAASTAAPPDTAPRPNAPPPDLVQDDVDRLMRG